MKQIISKNGVVYCIAKVPYPDYILKAMRKAGYKIQIVEEKKK